MPNSSDLSSHSKTKNGNPIVSIVTVVLNGESVLEETILSVIKQTYRNIEYIVIDGNSSDRTLDIIKNYSYFIHHWISKDDNGIYDAMNVGASMATGQLIGFLNAGDYLFPNAISELADSFKKNNFDYSLGPVIIEDENASFERVYNPLQNINIDSNLLSSMPSAHMSIYMKRSFFNELDGFDLNFKLSSDYDLIIRAISISDKNWYFSNPVGVFKTGGASGSFKTHIENYYVYKKHYAPFLTRFLKLFFSLLRASLVKITPKKIAKFFRSFLELK